jgi:predicted nucleotidyltransferase
MSKLKKLAGAILMAWAIVRYIPDTLESFEATARYGRWLYSHLGSLLIANWFQNSVVLLIGAGLIFSDTIQASVFRLSQEKAGKSRPPIEKLEDQALYERAKSWLQKRLSNKNMKVERAIIFGSVIYEHVPTTDVDVIVILRQMSDKASARSGQKIKSLGKEFFERFGHELHVQLFLTREQERIDAFLAKLNKYEELILT